MKLLNDEIAQLINELREIEARIIDLTGDSIDTVIDRHGNPYMLSQAQSELRERAEINRKHAELQSAILNAIPAHITLLDGEGQLIEINDSWCEYAKKNGYADSQFGLGLNYLKTCDAVSGEGMEFASAASAGIRSVLNGEQSSFTMEYPCHSPTTQRWFRLIASPFNTHSQSGAVVMHLDITERKLVDFEMQRALSVFKSSTNGILVTDANQIALDINPAYSVITGFEEDEIIGKKRRIINYDLHGDGLEQLIKDNLKFKGFWSGEVRNCRKSGEVYIENVSISSVYDDEGQLLNYIVIFSDITQSKMHEAELDRVAHHDPLTGLPNRRLLTDRLQQALLKAKRNDDHLALCFIDLDNFKPINDKYGHSVGDRLLIEIANRLLSSLRETDTVSRIGGDEFILMLSGFKHKEELCLILNHLLTNLAEELTIEEHKVQVTASMGVVIYPDDNSDSDTLMRHADKAMYIAKESGRNQFHVYDSKLGKEVESRNSLISDIKNSLDSKEFVLFYQPKINLVDGNVIGFEALVRWLHPKRGLISPSDFLPTIIGSNIEVLFGEYVMRTAIEQLNEWQMQGHKIQVSVNVSANELRQINLIENINTQLRRFPILDPHQLEIEVVETAAIDDISKVISTLNQCRAHGIQVSLDDFGTGYSSLTICRQLPVDILKVDKSFVQDMLSDGDDENIVEIVISMAKAFSRKVIAEGVETKAHANRLIELGCEFGQGYGIAKPMPASEVLGWLAKSQPFSTWLK